MRLANTLIQKLCSQTVFFLTFDESRGVFTVEIGILYWISEECRQDATIAYDSRWNSFIEPKKNSIQNHSDDHAFIMLLRLKMKSTNVHKCPQMCQIVSRCWKINIVLRIFLEWNFRVLVTVLLYPYRVASKI